MVLIDYPLYDVMFYLLRLREIQIVHRDKSMTDYRVFM